MKDNILIFDLRPLLHGKISGVEVFTLNIAKEIAKQLPQNTELIFWTNSHKSFDFGEFQTLGTCIQTRIPNKIFNLTASIFRYPKIDQLIKKRLGTHDSRFTTLLIPDPRPSPVSKNCQKILTVHDLSPFRFPQSFNWKTRLFHKLIRFKKEIKESLKIIAVSRFTKREILSFFSVNSEKIQIIPEAADITDTNILAQKPQDILPKKFFLSLSTHEPRKNLKNLIQAFLEAQKHIPEIQLILVGRKNEKIFSECHIENHPNILCIERFISIEEKKWLYQNALGFLYLSFYEGFGLPILEAMSQGCPVIHGNNSAQIETAGNAGIAVDVKNIQEISEQMKLLWKNRELQKELSQKGKEHAKKFSWKKTGTELLKAMSN